MSRVTSPRCASPARYGALVRSIHGSASAAITPAARNESSKLESISNDGFQNENHERRERNSVEQLDAPEKRPRAQIKRHHQRRAQNRRAVLHHANISGKRQKRDEARRLRRKVATCVRARRKTQQVRRRAAQPQQERDTRQSSEMRSQFPNRQTSGRPAASLAELPARSG